MRTPAPPPRFRDNEDLDRAWVRDALAASPSVNRYAGQAPSPVGETPSPTLQDVTPIGLPNYETSQTDLVLGLFPRDERFVTVTPDRGIEFTRVFEILNTIPEPGEFGLDLTNCRLFRSLGGITHRRLSSASQHTLKSLAPSRRKRIRSLPARSR